MSQESILTELVNDMPDGDTDLLRAKNYLKKLSYASGDSIYEHLVDIIRKLLAEQPRNMIDNFEQYSWDVRQEKFRPNTNYCQCLQDEYIQPEMLNTITKLDAMFKLVNKKMPKSMLSEEEEDNELNLEEELEVPVVADLLHSNYYFQQGNDLNKTNSWLPISKTCLQAGFGISDSECFNIYLSLKMLAMKNPVSSVRFFGKILGMKANYYIAETNLTMEELDRRIQEFEGTEFPNEEMEEERAPPVSEGKVSTVEEETPDNAIEGEEAGEGASFPEPLVPQPPPLPPLPVSQWKPAPRVPPERPGQGVNGKVYWVCNNPGDDWICLPDVTPQQIAMSRQIIRCMTGDLDTEFYTYPAFEGTERHYLRAQIARIAAATAISPQGFYKSSGGGGGFGEEEEEEEEEPEDEEDEGNVGDLRRNKFYRGHALKDLLDRKFSYWVHHGKYILKQGRTVWWNPNADQENLDEENVEEEAEEEGSEIGGIHEAAEKGPSMMSPLSGDLTAIGSAWSVRTSSRLIPERSLAVMRSNLWPGAYAFAFEKESDYMYIGWGHKEREHNYSPPLQPPVWEEYPDGPEIMEMTDPTVAEEEAWRIAHLPPPPQPEMPGEGGEGAEEAEEEEESDED